MEKTSEIYGYLPAPRLVRWLVGDKELKPGDEPSENREKDIYFNTSPRVRGLLVIAKDLIDLSGEVVSHPV